ncbi:hypothetical protein OTB20_27815 [Streptomyces sp. H27-H1]|nr:hypothetical protein [Streptomyces sp. H27-H1]MCY0929931.1 hypothetical protein [Streptomyces sp. H27-H1]
MAPVTGCPAGVRTVAPAVRGNDVKVKADGYDGGDSASSVGPDR